MEKNFPKAVKKYFEFSARGSLPKFNIQNLYKFFDEQGIICSIEPDYKLFWKWKILEKRDWCNDDVILKSRLEAEKAAFMYAFKILEERLK